MSDIIVLCQNNVQALINFGLTETQARVYLYLHFLGPSKVNTISFCSKIPRQDIYRVLSELSNIGLIEIILTKPKQFKAMPPMECLEILTKSRNTKTEEFKKTFTQVIKNLEQLPCPTHDEDISLLLIQNKEPILKEAKNLIYNVKNSIEVLSPHQKLFPWIFEHLVLLEQALKKGVKIRFITDTDSNSNFEKQTKKFNKKDFQIRYLPTVQASFGVYDNKQIILELTSNNGYLESQTLLSHNSTLVELAKAYFENNWQKIKQPILNMSYQ